MAAAQAAVASEGSERAVEMQMHLARLQQGVAFARSAASASAQSLSMQSQLRTAFTEASSLQKEIQAAKAVSSEAEDACHHVRCNFRCSIDLEK